MSRKILVIARSLPRYDRGSGHLRFLHLLEILAADNEISYFSENYVKCRECDDDVYTAALEKLAIKVFKEPAALDTLLTGDFELVVFEFYDTAVRHLPKVKTSLPRSVVVIDTVDVHFAREIQMASVHNDEVMLQNAIQTRDKELAVYRLADLVWAVTEEDKTHLLKEDSSLKVGVIPNIHKLKKINRDRIEENTLLFIGNFWHQPNEDAMVHFCEQIFPAIVKEVPEAVLKIIGNAPTDKVKALAGDHIKVVGWVPETTPYLETAHVSVVPLRYGAGMKGKVGEAMSSGVPVISSPIGVQGMDVIAGQDILVAESDEDFANSVVRLLRDKKLCKEISENGMRYMNDKYGYELVAERVRDSFSECLAIDSHRTLLPPPAKGAKPTVSHKVDIIMPTYNTKIPFLDRAIRSILAQNFANWRLIIVKDGGDCDISGVVKGFHDDRILLYEIPHSGKPSALNFALTKAEAEYIAYLDDDDIWYPNHLEVAITHMQENKIEFLHTDAYEVTVLKEDDELTELFRKILNLGVLTDKTLVSISHINAIHTRELSVKAGPYDVKRQFFIDWDMFIRMARHSRPQHLNVPTCEHYIYVNKEKKQVNTITGKHKNDPELSRRMQMEMYRRCHELLTPDDFVDFVFDWGSKNWQVNNLSEKMQEAQEELKRAQEELANKTKLVQELHNSLSWRITAPLRWLYDRVMS